MVSSIPVSIINDTSGEDHTGCNAVMDALTALCAKHGLDVIERLTRRQILDGAAPYVGAQLVIINGEGSLHHNTSQAQFFPLLLRRLDEFHQPAVLINTVWDTPDFMDKRAWELMHWWVRLVSVRESLSHGELIQDWCGPEFITPDLSFWHYSQPEISEVFHTIRAREHIGYSDLLPAETIDTLPQEAVKLPLRPARPLAEFLLRSHRFKEYHTARFHGLCFALMAGVPEIQLYPANTHKISGLQADVDAGGGARAYCDSAATRITEMMKLVAAVARGEQPGSILHPAPRSRATAECKPQPDGQAAPAGDGRPPEPDDPSLLPLPPRGQAPSRLGPAHSNPEKAQ